MTTLSNDPSRWPDEPTSDHPVPLTLVPIAPVPDAAPDQEATACWAPHERCRYRGLRLAVKRLIDLTISVPLLILTMPLMVVIAIAVRLGSPGPAIYRQVRVGRDGRHFTIFKFRTMHLEAEARLRADPDLWNRYLDGGFKLSLEEDPRVSRFGGFLRKTSLDELPQLLNVIKGDMSLVGPRPVIPEELEQYGGYLTAYLMAAPGLTGAWQVAGRDAVQFPGRAHLDAAYLDNWSLPGDLWIILRTLPAAVTARGVR